MNKRNRVLVTGSSGFIGKALTKSFLEDECLVIGASRQNGIVHKKFRHFPIASLKNDIDWSSALDTVDMVIHTAGRAHVLRDKASVPLEEFMEINCDASVKLAEQAIKAGVKRFIFISSIGVNGEYTKEHEPFTELQVENPIADYAISKHKAEKELINIVEETQMELVIIRPTLVYDVDAPGNFERLLKLSNSSIPLPFYGVSNKRSLVYLHNLVDFIKCCSSHEKAAGETFLISDGNSVSTAEMVGLLRKGMGKKKNMFYIPKSLTKLGALILNKRKVYIQLFGNLEVDIEKAKSLLNWKPKRSSSEALLYVGRNYKGQK